MIGWATTRLQLRLLPPVDAVRGARTESTTPVAALKRTHNLQLRSYCAI